MGTDNLNSLQPRYYCRRIKDVISIRYTLLICFIGVEFVDADGHGVML